MHESWRAVLEHLRKHGGELRVPRFQAPHPASQGMRKGRGLPVGQRAHWRLELPDGAGLHIHEHARHYNAHVDRTDPGHAFVRHVRQDTPGIFAFCVGVLGALLGWWIGRARGAALGAGAGAAVGYLTAGGE